MFLLHDLGIEAHGECMLNMGEGLLLVTGWCMNLKNAKWKSARCDGMYID